jgi:dTDP-4-amino-4,6-dideoxygalactose transaminase
VVSLHATKPLGVGEGGFVICTDGAFIDRLRQVTNFGFSSTRIAWRVGINAKLSEYHAAIGLVQLQKWTETRRTWFRIAAAYRDAFAFHPGIRWLSGYGEHWTSSTAVFRFVGRSASDLARELSRHNVEARRWWQSGVGRHPAFADVDSGSLTNTDRLANETLALPCYLTLRDPVIESVVAAVTSLIDGVAFEEHGPRAEINSKS